MPRIPAALPPHKVMGAGDRLSFQHRYDEGPLRPVKLPPTGKLSSYDVERLANLAERMLFGTRQ